MSSSPAPSAFGSCGRRETARASGNRSRGLSRVSDQELAPPAAPPGRRSAGKQRRTVTYGDSTLLRQLVRQRVRRRGGFRRSCIVLAFYLVRPRLEEREREEVSKQVGVRARVRCSGDDQPLFVEKNAAFPSARRRPANRSGEGLGHNPCPDLFEVSPISLPSCGAPESTLKPLRLTSAAMVSRKVVRF